MSAGGPLVVVGGGAAGHAAVAAYREVGGTGPVALVCDEASLPYERPPLSKELLRGEQAAGDLPIEDEAWWAAHDVDVHLASRAVALDPHSRTVALHDGTVLPYRTCVLTTGSSPVLPPIPGTDGGVRVHLLRSVAHGLALREAAERARSAVVVGSGFVGCEAAASLAARGLAVTLVAPEDVPHAERLGDEVGRRIAGWLEAAGVTLRMGTSVASVDADGTVRVSGGSGEDAIAADLVLLATGHVPNGGLAEDAGIATRDGRVVVDAGMRSATDGVLAAGDVALAENAGAGRALQVEHWGEAEAMGEVAGRTAAGADASWAQAPGFWSVVGEHTLKQVAWGDGWDDVRLVDHGDGAFTAWYGRDGVTVGVLTHGADGDYEDGRGLVEDGAAFPPPGR